MDENELNETTEFELEEQEEYLEEDNEDTVDKDAEIELLKQKLAKAEEAIIKNKQKAKSQATIVKQPVKYDKTEYQADILRSNGVTNEELEQIKKIAVLEDKDLIDARNSELFKLWKTGQEEAKKQKDASLPASKRGIQLKENHESFMKRAATSQSLSKDDIKKLIHGDKK